MVNAGQPDRVARPAYFNVGSKLAVGRPSGSSLHNSSWEHRIDPTAHYARSQRSVGRIPLRYLRALADTIPGQSAITRISDGVIDLPWSVSPPKDLRSDEMAIATAKAIEDSIREPNYDIDGNDTYSLMVSAMVADLTTLNVSTIERQRAEIDFASDVNPKRAFWLWAVDPDHIRQNLDWRPERSGLEPRYFFTQGSANADLWEPLMDEDLFVIKRFANTYRYSPPGPMEVAFRMIAAWLGLSDFQQATTSRASQEYLLDIGPASATELQQFRDFFEFEVLQEGKPPIVGSKPNSDGVRVVKLGASNDEGLYLQYQDSLLRMIALAFKLSARDFNRTEHDNRATSEVAADTTFQFAILPMAKTILERIQKDVVNLYYPGYVLRMSDTQPRDQLKEAQTAGFLYDRNIITKNEVRLDTGKEPLGPDGDFFLDGSRFGGESEDVFEDEDPDNEELDDEDLDNGSRSGSNGRWSRQEIRA